MAGFGRSSFGTGPFGSSDVGQDLVVDLFPTEYYSNQVDNTQDPLYHLLEVYANSVNLRREDIDNLPTIIDYETMASAFLLQWGSMLGIDIDKNDPDSLQRTLLGNASQWLQIKGSTEGYEVRGLASGFAVQVVNYWRIDPVTVAPFIPLRFQYMLKPKEADPTAVELLYTTAPPGTYPGTPTVETPEYAKSSFIGLVFSIPPLSPLNDIYTGTGPSLACIDFNFLLDLVIAKITDVQAIHHELTPPQFETIVTVGVSGTLSIAGQEQTPIYNAGVACYFDIIPADVEPLDMCLQVAGLGHLDDEDEIDPIDAAPTVEIFIFPSPEMGSANVSAIPSFENMEFSNVSGIAVAVSGGFVLIGEQADPAANVGETPGISGLAESASISIANVVSGTVVPEETDEIGPISEMAYFDVVPADVIPLDSTLTMTGMAA